MKPHRGTTLRTLLRAAKANPHWLLLVVSLIAASFLCILAVLLLRPKMPESLPQRYSGPPPPTEDSSKRSDMREGLKPSAWHLPSRIEASLHGGSVSGPVWLLELSRLPNTRRVCITFDIHLDQNQLERILGTLRKKHVRASFFLTGHWAKAFPEAVRRIAAEGHELANHTFSHANLTHLHDEEIVKEVRRTDASIVEAVGNRRAVIPFVRYPYGARDRRVVSVLLKHGFIPVYWGLDSRDSMKGMTADRIRSRVLEKTRPGDIVLMHASSPLTADVLSQILDGLMSRGLKLVSLTEMLREGPVVTSDSS